MLFGAGMVKLALMLGSDELAQEVIKTFKGVFNRVTRRWEGGIASEYFNYSKEMSEGWTFYQGHFVKADTIYTSFLGRPLSNILKPSYRRNDLGGTAQNAVTQAVDVDAICYLTYTTLLLCYQRGIFSRYSTCVHDALYLLVTDEDAPKVALVMQEVHEMMYRKLLEAMHIDPLTFPEKSFKFESVDINQRYTKYTGEVGDTYSQPSGWDYDITASIDTFDEWAEVDLAEDYQSSASLIKYYKQNQAEMTLNI